MKFDAVPEVETKPDSGDHENRISENENCIFPKNSFNTKIRWKVSDKVKEF